MAKEVASYYMRTIIWILIMLCGSPCDVQAGSYTLPVSEGLHVPHPVTMDGF